jgi:hypothetical protein
MVRRLVSAIVVALLALALVPASPGLAKAHLIIVFPLRSTPELADVATQVTTNIVNRLAAEPGYDAQLLQTPAGGSLGAAAASAGADFYVVGALTKDDPNYALSISSFDASNDVLRSSVKGVASASGALPPALNLAGLIVPASTPSSSPSNLVSGLAIGTPISILLDNPLSSRGAASGQTFSFHSAHDIYAVDGAHVAILKGAPGAGEIGTTTSASGNGSGGKITLQFDWIIATDGTKIPLTSAESATEGGDTKGASSTATIATYLLLGPLGFFAHNFVRGKDAEISTKTPLTAYVDRALRPGPISTLPPANVDSTR